MKLTLNILKWVLYSFFGLIVCLILGFPVYNYFFYEREMNQIKTELNNIENVVVVDIWGHDDISLEEVSARLKIKNKGELVLSGLSSDVFNYPNRVPITEIGNYSFTWFSCNGGIGPGIDIGIYGEIGFLFENEFRSAKDVIESYDNIIREVQKLKVSPEINHFETENSESYLLVANKKTIDQDPLLNLVGIEKKFEYAETLIWNKSDCYYNN